MSTSFWTDPLFRQASVWTVAGLVFWFLSRWADRESLVFVALDALTLVSGLVALLTLPFAYFASILTQDGGSHGLIWTLSIMSLSLLLCADALIQMRRFFLE